MSEILIRGMEMPKSCGECRASGTDVCRKWMGKKNLKVRSEDCPLVELPEHGNLKDENVIREGFKNYDDWFVEEAIGVIENAPTVLEASE